MSYRLHLSRRPAPALFAALALALGCGGELPEGTVAVSMYDNGYSPPVVRVPVGGRVIFRNLGRNQHHAIALDESWSTEADFGTLTMEQGDTADVVFDRPGLYPYYCTYHGSPMGDRGMTGMVVVGDVEYSPASDSGLEPVRQASGHTIRVPQDHARIQQAVDAAAPGDLVLIDRGVYQEEVRVTTPSLVLRGVDRNEVILDGQYAFGNGVLALADGVAVENMTARNYSLNGFYWTGATGYRGSYLTAYNNGDYGIYAFDSVDGLLEHSYASGSPDAGFYIGQCYPCRTVIRNVVAENNALGYSGTNAGGDLFIVSSIWRHNMAGLVPNTLDTELLPPQRETTIVGNYIHDNNNLSAPAKPLAWPAFGNGVLVAGGRDNVIERNVIVDHENHGVTLLPNVDQNFWPAVGNVVRGNWIQRSRRADLALAPTGRGNCFADNDHRSSAPPQLERLRGCEGLRAPFGQDVVQVVNGLRRMREASDGDFPRGEIAEQPVPPDQPQLPGGATAPVRPAVDVFASLEIDLRAVELPQGTPVGGRLGDGARLVRAGFGGVLGRSTAFLPLVLYLLWTGLVVVDLRRRRMSRGARGAWLATTVLVPFVGALLYFTVGRSTLSGARRLGASAGGLAIYLAALWLSL